MTFLGLSMLDLYILFVFGEAKKGALKKMFTNGSEEDLPARFFKRAEVAKKTVLITDQQV
jgi:6-phosphogluconolactonase/glucosamine-6-phosphate isomerase/deaminase